MKENKKPVIAIVGETGSGKTNLAIQLAKKYNGEIISADSRAIYKYLDIGTAKPTEEELDGVKIWGIDLIKPYEKYSVYEYQKYAKNKIEEIHSRNKIAILVGGSGLYIDSVILNYQFSDIKDSPKSVNLNKMSIDELTEYCIKNNIILPENKKNKRFLINSILRINQTSKKQTPDDNFLVLGINITNDKLVIRLKKRAKDMIKLGVKQEAIQAFEKYGHNNESMKGNIYSLLINQHIEDKTLIQKCLELDLKLAKKQRTWFKRNNFIKWIDYDNALEQAEIEIEKKFCS